MCQTIEFASRTRAMEPRPAMPAGCGVELSGIENAPPAVPVLSLSTTVLCVMSTIGLPVPVGTPAIEMPPPARPATLFATTLLYRRTRSELRE